MLPKKKRLTQETFSRFFASGKRFHGAYIQLIVAPSPTFHGSVVVGKKVYAHAVDRNRLRRQLYAVLSLYHKKNFLPCVYIVSVKPQSKETSAIILKNELITLLEKATKTSLT